MKEILIKMLEDLKAFYESKELEVNANPNCNAHTQGELKNRKQDIWNFEAFIEQANDPTTQSDIITNFREEADRIKADINKINCERNKLDNGI